MRLFKRIFSLILVPVLLMSVISLQLGSFAIDTDENGTGVSVLSGGSAAAPMATYVWKVNYYVKGTTTAIIPATTGSTTQSNYQLQVFAETIPGYFLDPFEQSPVSVILTQPMTTINFEYTPRSYTLSFESNGGTPINPVTANTNTPIVQPTSPVKEGFIFSGWFKDAGLTQLVSWPYPMPYQGGTLYAGWSATPVTLTFNANNGTPVAPVTTIPGAIVQKPTDPTRNLFRFDGWFYDISFSQAAIWPLTMPSNSFTLYAKWVFVQGTMTFNPNGGTTVSPITMNPGQWVYPPNDPARIGYAFSAWYYDNGTFANPVEWPVQMIAQGYTVYAKWNPNTVTITYDSMGGSEVEPLTALVGSSISAPVPPSRFGYTFAGWLQDNGDPFTFEEMPTQDTLLVASWNPAQRYVQVKLDAYKTVSGNLVPATQARAGEIVTVELTPQTSFFCGSSRFIIMYDPAFYTVLGTNKTAITPNPANSYYAGAIASYSGSTGSPVSEWPVTFVDGESARYKFVAANFTASSQSLNKGKPLKMDGQSWLYRIRLQVKADAEGSGQIWMDSRWDRSATYTTGGQYYFYCTSGTVLSSSGVSTLNFDTEYSNANETVALDTSPMPTSNIIFNTNGGTPVATMNGEIGTVANPPVNPVREGYTFLGWDPAFPATFPASDMTLNAQWQINTYNADFMVDGTLYQRVPTQFGAQIAAPAPPSKAGYTFVSWSPAVGTMGATDKTFTALFLINSYYATFMVDGQQHAKYLTEYGAQIQLPSSPQKVGYSFVGWTPAVGTMPAADKTFTALFSVNSYNAYFVVDGETVATVPTPYGDPIIPPANPTKPGFAFAGWTPAVGTMPASERTFTATWTQTVFNAYFVVDSIPYYTVPATVGTAIVLPPAPEKTGYTFAGWNNLPALMPANDVTMTAGWTANIYTVTFMVDGSEYTTVNTAFGESIDLPAAPQKTGYTFGGWSNLPAMMPANDVTVNAIFTVNTYNAAFKVDGTVYANVPTVYGAEIAVPGAPPKTGYTFLGWLNVPATMPANDIEIDASFSVNSYTVTFTVDGGAYSAQTLPYGTPIIPPAQPAKTGYTFTGWEPLPATMPDYSFESSAVFAKNIHQAIFMVDGAEYAVVDTGYGDTIELPQIPSKTGYAFLGWSNLPDQMPDADVVITDNWAINSYDALFVVDGENYAIVTTQYGEPIALPPSPTKAGLYFGGWSPAVPAAMPAYTLEFTALWVTEAFNAIFMVDGNEYARVLTGVGAPIEPPADPAKQGFVFDGWDPALPAAMPGQDIVFNALWSSFGDIALVAKDGSTTVIDQTGGLIYGLAQGISASEFANNFVVVTGAGELRITYYNGTFGTGTKVELLNAITSSVLKTYYIVIFGDVNGDGLVNAADRDMVKLVSSYQAVLPAGTSFALAADLTGDGATDAFDLNVFKAVIAGVAAVDQTKPGTLL